MSNSVRPVIARPCRLPSEASRAATRRPRKPPAPRMLMRICRLPSISDAGMARASSNPILGPWGLNGRSGVTASWADLLRGGNGARSAVVGGGMVMHAVNVFIVTTILPSVVRDIGGPALFRLEHHALCGGVAAGRGDHVAGAGTDRSPAQLPPGTRPVHAGLGGMRAGAGHGGAAGRPLRAGTGRGHALRACVHHDPPAVPRTPVVAGVLDRLADVGNGHAARTGGGRGVRRDRCLASRVLDAGGGRPDPGVAGRAVDAGRCALRRGVSDAARGRQSRTAGGQRAVCVRRQHGRRRRVERARAGGRGGRSGAVPRARGIGRAAPAAARRLRSGNPARGDLRRVADAADRHDHRNLRAVFPADHPRRDPAACRLHLGADVGWLVGGLARHRHRPAATCRASLSPPDRWRWQPHWPGSACCCPRRVAFGCWAASGAAWRWPGSEPACAGRIWAPRCSAWQRRTRRNWRRPRSPR